MVVIHFDNCLTITKLVLSSLILLKEHNALNPISGDFHYTSSGMTSGQRPDVVPGNAIEPAHTIHESMATGLSPSELSNENSSMSALNQGIYIYK